MPDKYIALVSGNMVEKEATSESAGAADAGKILALDETGKIPESALPTGIGAEIKLLSASEALSGGNFVNIYNDAGTVKCRKADASANKPAHGFVLDAVTSGNNATVYTEGINNALTGLAGGSEYFLAAIAGTASAVAPSTSGHISQKVGIALSATEIAFEPSNPVTLA